MKKWPFTFLFLLLSSSLFAQFRFNPRFDIPVNNGSEELIRAWDGGMNSPQFQTIDLNQDGNLDLAIYHRIARDITTYVLVDGNYVRSPQFDQVFPNDTRSLFLLKDFDCDGKKDLFTSTTLGIKVYKNISDQNGIAWSLASPFLTFDNGSNIQLAPSDIPGIEDVNGDGALDILTFRFGNANSIDLYLNTGGCGSLSFERTERRWGDFEECGCNDFVFGESCPNGGGEPNDINLNEDIQHIGGKTILLFDADNDGDMDLITSDETCETLYFMENEGDQNSAKMTTIEEFPANKPAGFPFFPSAFLEDIDQDGLKDLLIATNADENIGNLIELSDHIKMYSNVGTSEVANFQNDLPFLQNEMIDLGENTYPAFADFDDDGDQDLFVGNKGLRIDNQLTATIYLFENIGNPIIPSFKLIETDFLEIGKSAYTFIKPQFVDVDGDQDLDLLYQATQSFSDVRLIFRENTGNFLFGPETLINASSSTQDNPHFYDIDDDGDIDLFLGKQFGSLSLLINEGNLNFGPELESFAGILDDFERLNLNVFIDDFDNNGIDDLITTDLTGQLRIYRGPIDLDFLATNPIPEIIFINDTPLISAYGIQSAIATANVFGTQKPSVILGNTKGGLAFLENLSENNGPTDEIIIRIRPNPTSTVVQLLTNVNGTLNIFNSLGQLLLSNIPVIPGIDQTIDVSTLPAGIYILRVISEQNQTKSTKLIIE